MNIKRLRLILVILLAGVMVLFVAVNILGMAFLSSKSSQLVKQRLESKSLDSQLASLSGAKKEVEQYAYFNNIAKTVIPSDKDQAQAVLDISQLASQAGIGIASVTFPASTLGAGAAATSGTAGAKSPITQAKPVDGIPGVYSLELSIAPQTGPGVPADKVVTYTKLLDFLKRIENDRRTAQVTQVNIQPQGTDTGPNQLVNFTITINIFIKP